MGTDIRIALSLFTVLAPAGAFAFVILSLRILFKSRTGSERERLEHFLIAPLAVCLVGLIASATHLGSPSNALYVIMGWGRSPLSNEVVAAVGFLFLAGIYWLGSFNRPRWFSKVILDIWLILTVLAAFWLITMISVVYNIETIPTWSSSLVPFSIWLVALAAGPPLALAAFALSGVAVERRFFVALLAGSVLGLLGGVLLFALQYAELTGFRDSYGSADTLVPWYLWCLVLWCVLGAGSTILNGAFLLRIPRKESTRERGRTAEKGIAAQTNREYPRKAGDIESSQSDEAVVERASDPGRGLAQGEGRIVASPVPTLCGALLLLAAGFAMRVPFYAMHLTAGL